VASIEEFSKKIELSLGAIVLWTTMLISGTYTLSTIYWNFTTLQERVDKRHSRLVEYDDKLEERILYLEDIYSKKEVVKLQDELQITLQNNVNLTEQINQMKLSIEELKHETNRITPND